MQKNDEEVKDASVDGDKKTEQEVKESSTVGLATEILEEFKRQNERLISAFKWITVLLGLVVGAFLLYLYQYDFIGSIEQNGVYTLVDSSGNVISSDITPEQMEDILKIINGEGNNNEKKD